MDDGEPGRGGLFRSGKSIREFYRYGTLQTLAGRMPGALAIFVARRTFAFSSATRPLRAQLDLSFI
jgi:hypothetical protein